MSDDRAAKTLYEAGTRIAQLERTLAEAKVVLREVAALRCVRYRIGRGCEQCYRCRAEALCAKLDP